MVIFGGLYHLHRTTVNYKVAYTKFEGRQVAQGCNPIYISLIYAERSTCPNPQFIILRMDPLSIAAAVVGIAGFGLQVHQALFAFVNNVSNADQCIQALMTDINLTVSALRSIHELLKDEEGLRQTSRGRRLFSDDGLADTKRAAEQCMVTFKSIVAFILKKGKKGKYEVGTNDQDPNYLRLNRAHILSKLEKINWAIAQAQVDLYTARLVTFKISLLLIFSVISLKAQHQDL